MNVPSLLNSDLSDIGFYTLSDERVKNVSGTSQMMRCEMIITEYCNFKCPYCRGLKDDVFGDRPIKQLSLDEIKRNIDLWCAGPLPLKNIRFSGGEPTLHKNIVEAVEYAKFKGIERIAISSNGASNPELYRKLVDAGCNDFSISLDACCAAVGDKMAGGIKGAFDKVVANIKMLSQLTYVTVGVVLTEENINSLVDTVVFAHNLGVSDIRIISAAQWNRPLPQLEAIHPNILAVHPILAYRVRGLIRGSTVRGLSTKDADSCAIILDDSVIAGQYHYPCVIYMREQGKPIGKVGKTMRKDRVEWHKNHNPKLDPICSKNCLDVCRDHNKKYELYRSIGQTEQI